MAYVAPNSTIKLLRNVPLEPDYVNTLTFATTSAQTTYFSGKAKYTLTAQSYQRSNKGVCRVNYKVEDLYDINYMMFQNTSFGTKWFYAFVTQVDYVNNVTADVHYEIDVMQTWLKDMSLRMCFVEREHSGSDNIGDNIVAEPIDTGELVFNNYEEFDTALNTMAICVLTVDTSGQASGMPKDGIYSGATMRFYGNTQTGIGYLNAYLDTFNQKPDAIVGIYMLPVTCMDATARASLDTEDGATIVFSTQCEDYDYPVSATPNKWKLNTTDTIDGHVVRNKKLFTYPYNYLHIDNANGRSLALRYEFFTNSSGVRNLNPQFKMFSNICMPVTVVLRPKNYKGVKNNDFCKTESIDLTQYPMCSWNMDSWKAWVAQNAIPEAISAYTSVFNAVGNGVSSIIGMSTNKSKNYDNSAAIASEASAGAGMGVEIVGGILTRAYKASIKADMIRGSLNNANINVSSHTQNFYIGRVSVNAQQAKIIDDFFDKYGYATNEVKVPNVNSRTSWNYVKTIGSNVDGNIPGDHKRIIDANFDKGITFWHDPAHVDDYSQNNAPVSP